MAQARCQPATSARLLGLEVGSRPPVRRAGLTHGDPALAGPAPPDGPPLARTARPPAWTVAARRGAGGGGRAAAPGPPAGGGPWRRHPPPGAQDTLGTGGQRGAREPTRRPPPQAPRAGDGFAGPGHPAAGRARTSLAPEGPEEIALVLGRGGAPAAADPEPRLPGRAQADRGRPRTREGGGPALTARPRSPAASSAGGSSTGGTAGSRSRSRSSASLGPTAPGGTQR